MLGTNSGYTGGNTIGMAHAFAAGADYVWLLNSDAVAAPDTLAKLVAAADVALDTGLASPVLRERIDDPHIHTVRGQLDLAAPSKEKTDAIPIARNWLAERPSGQRAGLWRVVFKMFLPGRSAGAVIAAAHPGVDQSP